MFEVEYADACFHESPMQIRDGLLRELCLHLEFISGAIEIVYAKSKPSISGAKEMVNQSRKALKLPPL